MTHPHHHSQRRHAAYVLGTVAGISCAALVVTGSAIAATGNTGAAPTSATFVKVLGHQELPAVSPGGIALGPSNEIYLANTGSDTVAKYAPGASTPTWEVGKRGQTMQQGSFIDPRDVTLFNGHVYVAEPGKVQVLDDGTGKFVRALRGAFKVPLGVSTGVFADGSPALLVSDGRTGAVSLYDAQERLKLTIPERVAGSGTRDADTDSHGNIYVADYRNNRINKYTPTGQFVTSWDGGASCGIPKPYGVDVDDAGHIYVAASNNNLIRMFSATGQCLKTYGKSGVGQTTLSQLRRVAVSKGANPTIYAADLWGLKVLEYNAAGAIVGRLGTGTYPAPGGLNETTSVLVDNNAVYATDLNDHRITVWRPTGAVSTFGVKGRATGKASFNWPQGLGLNPSNGHVWVGDTHSDNIKEFPAFGSDTALRQFGGAPGKALSWPGNIAVDNAGNIYVVELSGSRVSAYTAALQPKWVATGLAAAQGIAWDQGANRLVVSTGAAKPIVALNPATGAKTALAVSTGAATNQLGARPAGVAIDAQGRIWVGDTSKNRVVMLSASGAYTFAFGSPGATNGKFNHPMGLDFGPDGNLYVADSWNSRIQVFSIH